MKYLNDKFSSGANTKKYRDNHGDTFGNKEEKECECGMRNSSPRFHRPECPVYCGTITKYGETTLESQTIRTHDELEEDSE